MPERVIEPGQLREAAAEASPTRDPLFYNEHVAEFLADVPDRQRRAALRRIERDAAEWASRLSPAQRRWVIERRRRRYRGTVATAEVIVAELHA